MKRLFLFACVFLLLGVLSCDKKEEINILEEMPDWAYQRVEELTNKGESCKYITVALYKVNGEIYYNIDFSYSSCAMCKLYDARGNRVSLSEKLSLDQFKFVKTLPACK